VDEVGGHELGDKRGQDVGEEDEALGEGTDEVLRGGEDDYVEDVVDETCFEAKERKGVSAYVVQVMGIHGRAGIWKEGLSIYVPNNQNAIMTLRSW
jgi:hypothetical protein